MGIRLQHWIEADPHFRRSEALSRRRFVLSHPILRRYYLGERVDFQVRGCGSVPLPPPKDMRAGKQMVLTDVHTEGIPHMELIRGGDYDEFCQVFLMRPIGSRFDSLPRSTPSHPLGTRSSRASGSSARTPRRRPVTLPSSFTPVEGPSRAGPSHSVGAFRIPQAISKATRPVHPGLANLHLPYSISYYTPEGTSSLREVSLDRVNCLALPPDDINEVMTGKFLIKRIHKRFVY
ncbi:uncharacterized protein LOC119371479 [Jatropha curcas]|nr:uncharacterized protein LOC119371479 [Jatropha curcas]